MRNKLLLSVSVFIFGLGLWAINFYVYNWTSIINIFPCSEKSIEIEDVGRFSNGKRFDDFLDLSELANRVKANPNYLVAFDGDFRILIERNFNGKVYTLSFQNNHNAKTTNFNFLARHLGEEESPCSTPNYWILQNAYKFVTDLPFDDNQKKQLKINLIVLESTKFL